MELREVLEAVVGEGEGREGGEVCEWVSEWVSEWVREWVSVAEAADVVVAEVESVYVL